MKGPVSTCQMPKIRAKMTKRMLILVKIPEVPNSNRRRRKGRERICSRERLLLTTDGL
jgi:hypothetical protein